MRAALDERRGLREPSDQWQPCVAVQLCSVAVQLLHESSVPGYPHATDVEKPCHTVAWQALPVQA